MEARSSNYSQYSHILWIVVIALMTQSCDMIYDYSTCEEPAKMIDYTIRVRHNLETTDLEYHVGLLTRAAAPDSICIRYLFRAYSNSMVVAEKEVYKEGTDFKDFSVEMQLPEMKDEKVYVWADYVKRVDDKYETIFYDAGDFSSVNYRDSPQTSTLLKDCFNGEFDVDFSGGNRVADVWLSRPTGRYFIIATDLDKFDDAENLSDYKVRVSYPLYFPSSLRLFDDRVSDVEIGVEYEFSIIKLDDNRALLGFDYSLLNKSEHSGIDIQIYLINPQGERRTLSSVLNVPMKRSQNTYIIGEFLNNDTPYYGGLGIDYSFDGEYTIFV